MEVYLIVQFKYVSHKTYCKTLYPKVINLRVYKEKLLLVHYKTRKYFNIHHKYDVGQQSRCNYILTYIKK